MLALSMRVGMFSCQLYRGCHSWRALNKKVLPSTPRWYGVAAAQGLSIYESFSLVVVVLWVEFSEVVKDKYHNYEQPC